MMVALSLPPNGDPRLQQPVGISSCGKTQNMDDGQEEKLTAVSEVMKALLCFHL